MTIEPVSKPGWFFTGSCGFSGQGLTKPRFFKAAVSKLRF
jgi:hypothetical protein